MIVTTLESIAGHAIGDTLGLVRGSALWSRRVTKYSYGGIRNLQATGLKEMDQGLNEAKDSACLALERQAAGLGADAIIGLRIDVIEMSNGVFCVNATGTAVKTAKLPVHVAASAPAADAGRIAALMAFERASAEGSVLHH